LPCGEGAGRGRAGQHFDHAATEGVAEAPLKTPFPQPSDSYEKRIGFASR